MSEVICLGLLLADIVGKPIEAFPPKGTLAAVEKMELHVGGCGANTAISLAKLGVSTGAVGMVGADGFGQYILQTLSRCGVDTRGVRHHAGPESTSATMVAVDVAGERTFLHYPGVHASFRASHVDWDAIAGARILHVAGPFLMTEFVGDDCAAVLRRAREQRIVTTLDTVWDFTERWMQVLEPSLPYLDYALPSLEEARRITGREAPRDIAGVLLDKGVGVVGLKLGEQGAYVRTSGGEEIAIPPFFVDAVDSLGAGDAWAAGFLCGLTHNWDLERTARFANAVGACCVQALGATTGVRSFEETVAMLEG